MLGGIHLMQSHVDLILIKWRHQSKKTDTEVFTKYLSEGYWIVRRTNRFWSGNFTDQTVEQVLMITIKSRGGLSHGRGVTLSTQSKVVNTITHIIPISVSLEVFSGINNTRQYKNTRVCISTGTVAPKVANVDSAVELGEVADNVLIGYIHLGCKQ